jgi:hypothetical protein
VRSVNAGQLASFLAGREERRRWAVLKPSAAESLGSAESRWLELSIDKLVDRLRKNVDFDETCGLALDADRLVTSFFPALPWSRSEKPAIAVLFLSPESYQPKIDALANAVKDRLSAVIRTVTAVSNAPPLADPLLEIRQLQAVRKRLLGLKETGRFGSRFWVTWHGPDKFLGDPERLLLKPRIECFHRAVEFTTIRVRNAVGNNRFEEARDTIDRVTSALRSEKDELANMEILLLSDERLRSSESSRATITETFEQLGRMRSTVEYVNALNARAVSTGTASVPP